MNMSYWLRRLSFSFVPIFNLGMSSTPNKIDNIHFNSSPPDTPKPPNLPPSPKVPDDVDSKKDQDDKSKYQGLKPVADKSKLTKKISVSISNRKDKCPVGKRCHNSMKSTLDTKTGVSKTEYIYGPGYDDSFYQPVKNQQGSNPQRSVGQGLKGSGKGPVGVNTQGGSYGSGGSYSGYYNQGNDNVDNSLSSSGYSNQDDQNVSATGSDQDNKVNNHNQQDSMQQDQQQPPNPLEQKQIQDKIDKITEMFATSTPGIKNKIEQALKDKPDIIKDLDVNNNSGKDISTQLKEKGIDISDIFSAKYQPPVNLPDNLTSLDQTNTFSNSDNNLNDNNWPVFDNTYYHDYPYTFNPDYYSPYIGNNPNNAKSFQSLSDALALTPENYDNTQKTLYTVFCGISFSVLATMILGFSKVSMMNSRSWGRKKDYFLALLALGVVACLSMGMLMLYNLMRL